MHAYRKLVEEQMAEKNMDRPALVDASKLSRQVVHNIVTDKRERLTQPPEEKTVVALAAALDLPTTAIWSAIGVAMGLPEYAVPAITHEVKDASNEALISQLANRLGVEVTVRAKGKARPPKKTLERRRNTIEEGAMREERERHERQTRAANPPRRETGIAKDAKPDKSGRRGIA